MKKLDLGQTANLVANVGVIAGIVFLAVELRQTSDAIQTSNLQSSIELGLGVGDWVRDPQFAEIYLKILEGSADLTDVERVQFDEFLGQNMNIWEFSFNAYENGTMSDANWASWDSYFSSWLRQDGIRGFWESTKRADYIGSSGFLEHVDSVLAKDTTQ